MFNRFKKVILAVIINLCLIGTLALLFFLNVNPADLESFLGARIGGAVSTTINKASVAENPFNKLALDLSKKEKELNRYEQLLLEREKEIEENSSLIDNRTLMVLGVLLTALFVLIALNFYFDHKRRKRSKQNRKNKEEEHSP